MIALGITLFKFEDTYGEEFGSYHTMDPAEAESYGQNNSIRVIAHHYQFENSEIHADYTAPRVHHPGSRGRHGLHLRVDEDRDRSGRSVLASEPDGNDAVDTAPRGAPNGDGRIEVVVYRYPDYSHGEGADVRVFLDGRSVAAHVTVVDPGRGHHRVDWELDCGRAALRATPAAATVIRRFYADAAATRCRDAEQATTR